MRQSLEKNGQQLLGGVVKPAAILKREAVSAISASIRAAANSAPPKVVAGLVDMSDEGVRKIRDGERQQHRLESIIAFMLADPTVAETIEKYARLAREPDLFSYAGNRHA